MPPEKLRGILFDKDGTLIDFDRTWGPAAYAAIHRLADGDRNRVEALMRVSHFVEAERRFLPTSPLIAGAASAFGALWAAALGREAGADFFDEMNRLFREEGLRSLTPIGAPSAIFATLATSGYALGIATNDTEASARAQAARLGLDPYLGFVAGYDSGFGRKPEPGMVLAFAAQIDVPPARIALVGDSPYDLAAARAAGAVAIAVLSGPLGDGGRDEMAPLADHVIGSIAELPGLLEPPG